MEEISLTVLPLRTAGDMAYNWRKFMRSYEDFVTAYYDSASDEEKIAILLHTGGGLVNDVFNNLPLKKRDRKNLEKVVEALELHFLRSTSYERFWFFSRKQHPGEHYGEFMATLYILSVNCDFGELRERLVKDMFISGLTEKSLRDELLRTPTTDINSTLEVCRKTELRNEEIRQFQESKKRRGKKKWFTCWMGSASPSASCEQLHKVEKRKCLFQFCPLFRNSSNDRNDIYDTYIPELTSFRYSDRGDSPIPALRAASKKQPTHSTEISLSSYENNRRSDNEQGDLKETTTRRPTHSTDVSLSSYENNRRSGNEQGDLEETTTRRPTHSIDVSLSSHENNRRPEKDGYLKKTTTKAFVHMEDVKTEGVDFGSRYLTEGEEVSDELRDDINCAIMNGSLTADCPMISELLFDSQDLSGHLRVLEEGYDADVDSSDSLMKGSVTSENKAERPKTLRKLRNVYESAKMPGEAEDTQEDGKMPEKGVLSPFDEQEEWAKISEIMASFGNLVRESVFITELEKEFQERLGLNLNDSSTSVGAGSSTVGTWLNSINMSQYEPIFISFGYDNLDFINGVLDDNDMKEMGIPEGDRNTILESSKSLNNKVALTRNETVNNNNNEEKSKESVEDWLERLDLSAYWDTFRKHLYTDMDRVKSVWEVELTAVLEISKPGHRHRIMASLPRSPNQPSIQDINAELSQLKNSMQELEGKVSSSTNACATGTGTLRHSHKKTRPAPPPPGKPQPDLQIRDPSQLLVGVPSTITAQWRHQPHALLTGTLTYHARYLGSTVVKVLRGAESTKKSIQKLKKPLSEQNTAPDIYLAISYHGVKFLSGDTKELVCEHEIRNIHLACQDAEDLTHFAYITKDRATKSHYCHVFSVQTMDQATEVILTLGQAFEVAYQMALREASNSKGNGHTRSYSANLAPITTQPNHNRSHSVNEIKLNGESISNGHTSTPSVLMSEDV